MYKPKLFTELQTYSKEKTIADIFAGLTVGILALPLAMAFAIASNLPPERGLFTAIIAGFLISVFGGSKVQIGGPTGAFVVIVSSIVLQHGYVGLAVATILAGIILIFLGLCRIGGLIKYVPFPVVTGFTTGIAVIIFSSQIADLFGLKIDGVSENFIQRWFLYFRNFQHADLQTAVIGLTTVVVIFIFQKRWPKLPSMLIGMAITTIIAYVFNLHVETIGSRFGDLPHTLPMPSIPYVNFSQLAYLVKPAFTIAFLAAIESLLSATVADGMIGGRHRPNAELIGQGIANIGSIIFGGIPATGAIARTATNIKSGARTPVSGIVHAITLMLLLFLFAPLAKLIPLATLAGILVVVSYNMSELRHFVSIFRGATSEAFVLVVTCLTTILVNLTVAIEVGIVLSFFLFVKRMSEIANVTSITNTIKGEQDEEDIQPLDPKKIPANVEVFEITGPFFFGMIDIFKNAIQNIKKPTSVLIIRTRNVMAIDSTGIHVLQDAFHQFSKVGTQIVFSGVHKQVLHAFKKAGFVKEVGEKNFCSNIDSALQRSQEIIDDD